MSYQPSKLFTVDQANAMLPLVRAIAKDLARLSRDMIERRQRLDHLMSGREIAAGNPYEDELAQMKAELEKDSERLREYARELQDLGVELKSAPDGLIDFPSEMDGRIVFLCWKLGEPEVMHWHELDSGFVGRQPLTAESVAGGDGAGAEGTLDGSV